MPEFSKYLIVFYIWQGFEYVSGIKYAWVLNMVWYSYNNIIIPTAAVIQYLNSSMLDFYIQVLHN